MGQMKVRRIIGVIVLLAVAGIALAAMPVAKAGGNNNGPDLPSPSCDRIQAPEGQRLAFHAYARGVQKYRWNGTAWVFVAPDATLYADAGYHGQVGIHYAGPTWESNSGSTVKASALIPRCTPDPTAIPWLLLETTSTNGPGIFSSVTYIQRVNTTGGLAPSTPGTMMDESREAPYTAEYYFYRAEN
ncbi:MAG TPA: DUF3455 domain-containing protein [Blastocatellia bacterium]|nr:DUF3455 domain-containing protein [Blastocatellia bacterium]